MPANGAPKLPPKLPPKPNGVRPNGLMRTSPRSTHKQYKNDMPSLRNEIGMYSEDEGPEGEQPQSLFKIPSLTVSEKLRVIPFLPDVRIKPQQLEEGLDFTEEEKGANKKVLTAEDLEEKARKIGWPVNLPLLSRDKEAMTEVAKFLRAMFTKTPPMPVHFHQEREGWELHPTRIASRAGSWQEYYDYQGLFLRSHLWQQMWLDLFKAIALGEREGGYEDGHTLDPNLPQVKFETEDMRRIAPRVHDSSGSQYERILEMIAQWLFLGSEESWCAASRGENECEEEDRTPSVLLKFDRMEDWKIRDKVRESKRWMDEVYFLEGPDVVWKGRWGRLTVHRDIFEAVLEFEDQPVTDPVVLAAMRALGVQRPRCVTFSFGGEKRDLFLLEQLVRENRSSEERLWRRALRTLSGGPGRIMMEPKYMLSDELRKAQKMHKLRCDIQMVPLQHGSKAARAPLVTGLLHAGIDVHFFGFTDYQPEEGMGEGRAPCAVRLENGTRLRLDPNDRRAREQRRLLGHKPQQEFRLELARWNHVDQCWQTGEDDRLPPPALEEQKEHQNHDTHMVRWAWEVNRRRDDDGGLKPTIRDGDVVAIKRVDVAGGELVALNRGEEKGAAADPCHWFRVVRPSSLRFWMNREPIFKLKTSSALRMAETFTWPGFEMKKGFPQVSVLETQAAVVTRMAVLRQKSELYDQVTNTVNVLDLMKKLAFKVVLGGHSGTNGLETKVSDLHEYIFQKINVPTSDQRLFFRGRELKPDDRLGTDVGVTLTKPSDRKIVPDNGKREGANIITLVVQRHHEYYIPAGEAIHMGEKVHLLAVQPLAQHSRAKPLEFNSQPLVPLRASRGEGEGEGEAGQASLFTFRRSVRDTLVRTAYPMSSKCAAVHEKRRKGGLVVNFTQVDDDASHERIEVDISDWWNETVLMFDFSKNKEDSLSEAFKRLRVQRNKERNMKFKDREAIHLQYLRDHVSEVYADIMRRNEKVRKKMEALSYKFMEIYMDPLRGKMKEMEKDLERELKEHDRILHDKLFLLKRKERHRYRTLLKQFQETDPMLEKYSLPKMWWTALWFDLSTKTASYMVKLDRSRDCFSEAGRAAAKPGNYAINPCDINSSIWDCNPQSDEMPHIIAKLSRTFKEHGVKLKNFSVVGLQELMYAWKRFHQIVDIRPKEVRMREDFRWLEKRAAPLSQREPSSYPVMENGGLTESWLRWRLVNPGKGSDKLLRQMTHTPKVMDDFKFETRNVRLPKTVYTSHLGVPFRGTGVSTSAREAMAKMDPQTKARSKFVTDHGSDSEDCDDERVAFRKVRAEAQQMLLKKDVSSGKLSDRLQQFMAHHYFS